MKNKSYSIHELVKRSGSIDIKSYIEKYEKKFYSRFRVSMKETIDVELTFVDQQSVTDFYNEIKYNPKYSELYRVRYHAYQPNVVVVSGKATLFDYFGSKEPNLLTLSRDLDLSFTINFIQDYSGAQFSGTVVKGELLARQCIVEVSDVLPELSLGMLRQIGSCEEEFDLLLTRFYVVEAQLLA